MSAGFPSIVEQLLYRQFIFVLGVWTFLDLDFLYLTVSRAQTALCGVLHGEAHVNIVERPVPQRAEERVVDRRECCE